MKAFSRFMVFYFASMVLLIFYAPICRETLPEPVNTISWFGIAFCVSILSFLLFYSELRET